MIKTIFIVSTGRTGTKSLAISLNNIPGITATHEQYGHAREVSNKFWDGRISRGEAIELLKRGQKSMPGVWVDSNCLLWNCISLLEEIYDKNVGYIFIQRRSQETIDSMMATGMYAKGKLPWEQRAQRDFIDIRNEGYNEIDRRQNCERAYHIRTSRIVDQLINVNPSRFLFVRFSSMVSDKETQNRIIEFINHLTGSHIYPETFHLVHEHKRPC